MCDCRAPHPHFDALVKQLVLLHDEEVGLLRAEIDELRARALAPEPSPRPETVFADPGHGAGSSIVPTASVGDGSDLGKVETVMLSGQCGDADLRNEDRLQTSEDVARPMSSTPPRYAKKTTRLRSLRKTASASIARAGLRRDWLAACQAFISGPGDVIMGVAILLNVILAFAQQELEGRNNGMLIGAAASDDFAPAMRILSAVSIGFTALFAIELMMKIVVLRRALFCDDDGQTEWFNIFDASIIVLSLLDAALLLMSRQDSKFSVLRGFRVIRILRVLRVARTLKVFASLRVLVSATFASFFALFWSMVLLGVVMVMAALFLCQVVGDVIQDTSMDYELRAWAYHHYGTSSRAAWTVFELTFSGGWPNYARPLVDKAGAGYAVFFGFYIAIVTFAMFRIITALFLKDTLNVASMDIDSTIAEKIEEKEHYAQKLADFFFAADTNADGYLSVEELETVLTDERLNAYLSTLDLDATKIKDLFVHSGSNEVSIDDFVQRAMRTRGLAKSMDVASLMMDSAGNIAMLEAMDAKLRCIDSRLRCLASL